GVQTDRQQLAAARAFRAMLDVRLSLPDPPGGAAASYAHVLAWKGAVLLHQQQRRLAVLLASGQDPRARALVGDLQAVTRRLASLALATPGPQAAAARLRELERLTYAKEDLERRLSA